MQRTFVMLFGLAVIGYAFIRAPARMKPACTRQLKGWQKLFGAVAIVVTVLIMLNPEFLALGLLGDTAFFEMFVLALSFQMHRYAIGACRGFFTMLRTGLR